MVMKRSPKTQPTVSTCWPIFNWVKCEKCRNELRREKVWTATVRRGVDLPPIFKQVFVCRECAKNMVAADAEFRKIAKFYAVEVTRRISGYQPSRSTPDRNQPKPPSKD